jgi:hypothetical protein
MTHLEVELEEELLVLEATGVAAHHVDLVTQSKGVELVKPLIRK